MNVTLEDIKVGEELQRMVEDCRALLDRLDSTKEPYDTYDRASTMLKIAKYNFEQWRNKHTNDMMRLARERLEK